jgi:hypothetical protein
MTSRAESATGRSRPAKISRTRDRLTVVKARFALDAARSDNLMTGEKTHMLSARLNEALVVAAKERTGITSDTQLVETALAMLAVDDDFGAWLVAQGGRLSADFEIDF